MESNPIAKLYEIINDGKSGPSFFMGEIIKPIPDIEVNTQGLPLYQDDLLIDSLLKDQGDLQVNDKVLLICLGEKYLILSKVVSL